MDESSSIKKMNKTNERDNPRGRGRKTSGGGNFPTTTNANQRRGGGSSSTRTRTESWPAVANNSNHDDQRYRQYPPTTTTGVDRPPVHPIIPNMAFLTAVNAAAPDQLRCFTNDIYHNHQRCPIAIAPPPHHRPNFYFEMEHLYHHQAFYRPPAPLFTQLPPPMPMPIPPFHHPPTYHQQHRGNLDEIFHHHLQLHEDDTDQQCKYHPSTMTTKNDNKSQSQRRNIPDNMPELLARRELGLVNNRDVVKRRVAEIRVKYGGGGATRTRNGNGDGDGNSAATTIAKILPDDYPGESLDRCQFMEATPDGTKIFGSWALRDREWSRIMCCEVNTKQGRLGRDRDLDRGRGPGPGDVAEGRYGISLKPSDNYIYVMDTNVVDLCQARVDVAVTCVLYITVPGGQQQQGHNGGGTAPQSSSPHCSRIFLQPVPELSDSNDESLFTTPIYNAHWSLNEDALSCAWDFTKMRLSLGMERYGMILDVVSERDFKLFSCHKSVLAQKFSRDGSLLFMGVRDSSLLCCDLRRQYHHAVYALPQSSVCWLQLLSDNNYLVAADLFGRVDLWDLRTKKVLSSFDGHTTSGCARTKMPVVVDEQDSLLFAVSDNGTTSGWSLKTGRLLREIPPPYPIINPSDHLPRICYSGCWGGVAGNAALVLGVGDQAHFYEFQL